MLYVLLTLVVLIIALMLLRLRFRLELSSERKLLFLGLGRSGPELDFRSSRGVVRLFGFDLWSFALGKSESVAAKIKTGLKKLQEDEPEKEPEEDSAEKPKRKRSWRDAAAIAPACARAFGRYLLGLIGAAVVERAEAEIEAGFAEPNLTGQAFGYYQAVIGVAPSLGRVQYIPIWSGPAFSGSANLSIAWPVYRLVWQTTLFLARLPLTKIVKLAIGSKEGAQDG